MITNPLFSKLLIRASKLLCCAVAFAFSVSALADLKVVSKVDMSVNGDYHPTEYTTTYYKGDWVRIDSKNRTILTNSATHKTYNIDHIHKTYAVSDSDLAQDAGDMMEMMGLKVSAKVDPADEHKKVAGLDADKYLSDIDFQMKMPDGSGKVVHLKMHMESWATTTLAVKSQGGTIVAPNDMLQSLFSLAGASDVKRELSKIKGFSLTSKITADVDAPDVPAPVSIEVSYEAVSVTEPTLSPLMFRVPPEYKLDSSDEDGSIPWRPAGKGG